MFVKEKFRTHSIAIDLVTLNEHLTYPLNYKHVHAYVQFNG